MPPRLALVEYSCINIFHRRSLSIFHETVMQFIVDDNLVEYYVQEEKWRSVHPASIWKWSNRQLVWTKNATNLRNEKHVQICKMAAYLNQPAHISAQQHSILQVLLVNRIMSSIHYLLIYHLIVFQFWTTQDTKCKWSLVTSKGWWPILIAHTSRQLQDSSRP